jgi:hypothetical protein
MSNNYIILVYGHLSGGTYELRMFYKVAGSWITGASTVITPIAAAITYTYDSDVWFHVGQKKVIVTDGVNRAHYFGIDKDGVVVGGILGIPAPTNHLEIFEPDGYQPNYFETNEDNAYLCTPGQIQAVYTVQTED